MTGKNKNSPTSDSQKKLGEALDALSKGHRNFRNSKSIVLVIIFFALFAAVGYGTWKVQRWWHWSWAYESQTQALIQQEMLPLIERIEALESKHNE